MSLIMPLMAERIRITFDVSERVRRALNIHAARMGCTVGEIIETLVSTYLTADINLADQAISSGENTGKKKRGRPPKTTE